MPQEQKAQIALAARQDSSFNKTFTDAQKKLQELQEKTAEAGKGFGEFKDKILEIAGVTYVFDKIKESVDELVESWGELTSMGEKVVQMEANLTGALQAQNDAMRGSTEALREHTEATERYIATRSRLSLQSKTAETALALQLIQLGVPTGTPLNAIMASVSRSTDVHGIYKTEAAQAYQSELTSALNRAASTGNTKGLIGYGYNTRGLDLNRKAKGEHEVGSAGWLQNLAILTNAINAQDKDKKVDERIKKLADANKKWEELQEKFADVALTISSDFAEVLSPFLDGFGEDFDQFCTTLKNTAAELMQELKPSIPVLEQWGKTVTKWVADFFAPNQKTWLPGGSFEALKKKPSEGGLFTQIKDGLTLLVPPLKAFAEAVANLAVTITGIKSLPDLVTEVNNDIKSLTALFKFFSDLMAGNWTALPGDLGAVISSGGSGGSGATGNLSSVGTTVAPFDIRNPSPTALQAGINGLLPNFSNLYGSGGAGAGPGGVKMTHYGYPGDPSPDSNSKRGIGDHDNRLTALQSAALTASERLAVFGVTGHSTGRQIPGTNYIDDDTAPESDRRIDVYDPQNVLKFARGGFVNRPTLGMLGEAGEEVVVPLSGDRNRSWGLLGAAMGRLGVRGAGGGHVIHFGGFNINVSGATESNAGELATSIGEMAMEYIRDQISTERSRLLPV
jgi:hypothetical protein